MPRHSLCLTLALPLALIAATASLAHDGVKDPKVKERMQIMNQIKAATGVLGSMAKHPASHDADDARAARSDLIRLSKKVAPSFTTRAMDPKSEARPAIWDNWDDFAARALALTTAAEALDPTSPQGVAAGMAGIGGACGGCHKPYRD